MDLETAQRIERLEYQIAVLYRHLGLDPEAGMLLPPPPGRATPAEPFGRATPEPRDAVPGGDPRLPRQFYDLLEQRKMIQAIKVYREATGAGLKESKDYVDNFIREHGYPR